MKITLIFLTNLIFATAFGQSKVDQAKKLFENKMYGKAQLLLLPIDKKVAEYAEARYYLGRIAFELKDYDASSEYFENAIEANNKMADYYVWLGKAYGLKAMKSNVISQGLLAPKIRDAWEKASELDPKNIEVRFSLIGFYTMAPEFMGGSFVKAKNAADQINKLDKIQGHLAYGTVYWQEKKFTEAENEFLESVKLDPSQISTLTSFYIEQKQYDKAFSNVDLQLKKNPQDYLSIYQIGKICAISGKQLDRGEECLKKYLVYQPQKSEPSIAGANMRLAQIYEKKGDKTEAKKLYKSAFSADASLKEAKEGLDRLSK
jgi:tetratricopeptide (TPR) repeat protein